MLDRGHTLIDRFVLIRRLGSGRASDVWLANDLETASHVALKVLRPEFAQQPAAVALFKSECVIARSLEHPHILRMHGVWDAGATVFAAMEVAESGDLSRSRGATVAHICRCVAPIAAALAYAHRRGVVHRDVKPANVLLNVAGVALLADFGVAAAAGAVEQQCGRGSLYNMSPQQLAGEPASPEDDAYGLGVLLYELLSGYPPFYPAATPERIRSEAPAPLPAATPMRAASLVQQLLAKQPSARPDMQTVEDELSAVAHAAV